MLASEELGWDALGALDPSAVCCRTGAVFNAQTQVFELSFFSHPIDISLSGKVILSRDGAAQVLLDRLGGYAHLAVLWYMLHASNIPPSGDLVNPADLSGGQIYTGGTHVLPVQLVADKYATDREGFIGAGSSIGGRPLDLADASLLLHPFPQVGIAVLLWLRDDEFSARSVLLVDASAPQQLPPDALWLTALLCLTALI